MSLDKWIHAQNQHPNQAMEHFHYPRKFSCCTCAIISSHLPPSQISVATDKFSLFQNIIEVASSTMYSFVNGFFHSA